MMITACFFRTLKTINYNKFILTSCLDLHSRSQSGLSDGSRIEILCAFNPSMEHLIYLNKKVFPSAGFCPDFCCPGRLTTREERIVLLRFRRHINLKVSGSNPSTFRLSFMFKTLNIFRMCSSHAHSKAEPFSF